MKSTMDDNDRLRAHGKGRLVEVVDAASSRPGTKKSSSSKRERGDGATDSAEWEHGLSHNEHCQIEATAGNLELLLRHRPEWRDVFAFDEMGYRPIWSKAPPLLPGFDPPAAHEVRDGDFVFVQAWARKKWGLRAKREDIETSIARVARMNPRHGVREYLDTLHWDGNLRLDRWLAAYLGADDTPLVRTFGARTLIAAVARIYRPGVKVDTMLVLEGPQGAGKSRALRALVRDEAWFDDHLPDLRDKDSMLHLRGLWIVEVAELDAFKGVEETRTKRFLSKQEDRCRPPYGRHTESVPRTCIFIGTTNNDQFLHDSTGGRRYWPVKVMRADVDRLNADRDQLWAEAVARYRQGEPWHLDAKMEAEARGAQEERFQPDPWEEEIGAYVALVKRSYVTVNQVLKHLDVETDKFTPYDAKRVAQCLVRLGWQRGRLPKQSDGKRPWAYFRPDAGGT